MRVDQLREVGLSYPGTTEEVLWGNNLVFKVAGKIFLITDLEPGGGYAFKCEEETFYELTEQQPGIIPAPYMARNKWVKIDPTECRLSKGETEELIDVSFRLVVAKLPKKTQRDLGGSKVSKPKARARKAR